MDAGLVNLDLALQRLGIVFHQLIADLVEHAPGGLVVDAQLALQLFGGYAASRAGHEIHGVEPKLKRSRGLVEDRPGRGVDMVPAAGAGPRLAPLFGRVAPEDALRAALGTVGMFSVGGVPGPPQML